MVMNGVTTQDSHDYVALSWVKNEIVNNLTQAQQALESLSEDPTNTSELAICHSLLHQVSGALHMVGFPGAALFAEEIKALCEALVNNRVEDFNSALQILMQAILQMPSYLEIIQTEGHDIPIALLPLINEMRASYKEAPLSEVELFSPKYHSAASPLTDEELQELNTEGLTSLLRKLRQSLQLSLIDIIHSRNLEIALDHLGKIFNYLGRLCKATPISTLWRVAMAFTTGITEKSISNTAETKELLKKIDKQIKLLVEQGVAGMNAPVPESLVKNLLFLIAQADSQAENILSIKNEFHLDDLILNAEEVNTNQIKLARIDRNALESVAEALLEELIQVKDQLDLLARNEQYSESNLETLPTTIKKISNTLEMLGLVDQRKTLDKQLDIINAAISSKQFDKNQFLDVASAILDIEVAITNIRQGQQVKKRDSSAAVDDAEITVIREAANELAQVKDILSLYFSSQGQEGTIKKIPALLIHTAGALSIISLQRAAAVVIRCLQYIDERIINSPTLLDPKNIDSLVGAIASVDYYMECLSKNQVVSSKDALNFAIKYLYELNFALPDDYESLTARYLESVVDFTDDTANIQQETSTSAKKTSVTIDPKTIISTDENIDVELIEIFSEELGEILESLSTTLPAWIDNTDDKDSLTEIRRSFHTIKGSGRMVKAIVIGELGWAIENMLNRVIDRTIPVTETLTNVIQDVVCVLPELITEFATGLQHQRADVDHYAAIANALANKQELPQQPSFDVEQATTDQGIELEETTPENIEDILSTSDETPEVVEDYTDSEVTETEETTESPITAEIEQESQPETTDANEFDVELIDIFIGEAKVHMQTLRAFLTLCERSLPQQVTDALQRAMHTLKGSALMAGLNSIAAIAKPFEAFLKECSISGWPIERFDLELLQDAYSLLNKGIRQLELYSLAPIEGTEPLVERIRLRREILLAQLEASNNVNPDSDSYTTIAQNISNLLLQDIDLLLDAEEYIKEWRKTPTADFPQIAELRKELTLVSSATNKANFNQISTLCDALLSCYDAIENKTINRDDEFFDTILAAHHSLLSCADQLAAAQVITDHPEDVARLNQLLANASSDEEQNILAFEVTKTEEIETVDAEIIETETIDPVVEATENEIITLEQPVSTSKVIETANPAFVTEDKLILGAPAPAGRIISSDDDIDQEMAEIFLEEADEILVESRQNLNNWIDNQNSEYLNALQRQLHTLKGGARMCGAGSLGDLAHGLEFIYEGLLNGNYSYSKDLIKLLNKTHDHLQLMVDSLHESQSLPYSVALLNAIQIFRQQGRIVLDDTLLTETSAPAVEIEIETAPTTETSIPTEEVIELTIEEPSISEEPTTEKPVEPAVIETPIATETIVETQAEQTTPEKEKTSTELTPAEHALVTIEEPKSTTIEAPKAPAIEFKPTKLAKQETQTGRQIPKEVKEQVKVSADLLDILVNLAGETSIYRSRVEQQASDLSVALDEMDATIERVRDQLRRLDTETQAQIISKHQTETSIGYEDFDLLEMDQYSQLQQLSRSLFESASDLQDLKDTLIRRNRDVETLLQQQGRVNTELQEGLMRTRMVPLERIAPRLRRLVRQVSTELGKQVELYIGNTAGEMDRGVIDAIVTPLEHMIRNSIDHGIESKEQRIAAGKPEKGTISLDLVREGGEMVLRLQDDGSGISIDTVREKAISKGLISSDENLSNKEILQFILEAGFSTAKRITQISGRGVGLDVVVNAVKQLGGVLSLDSVEGQGTTFYIRLPINLSVSRALMIRVDDDCYAIPMSTVEGVSYISPEQLKEFLQFGTAELEYGGESYRVKYLGELLGNHIQTQPQDTGEKAPVLLVRSGENYVALRVDELLPSNEIVVKSLGVQFLSVPAISGATILGDGHVIIILDLSALVRNYLTNQQNIIRAEERRLITVESELTTPKRPPLVMVVDDSVTVRKVTTRLLERQGMQVITARDGLDAVAQLEEKVPDIMLLDIEMPRMDGFEVATRVRHDERTKHLPIIMITSRSGEKHRERALAIGVNEYMSKPFMDVKLIKSISDLLPTFEVNLLESSS